MRTAFNEVTDLKYREIISGGLILVRSNPKVLLRSAFKYLFPLAFCLMMIETLYGSIISKGFADSFLTLVDQNDTVEQVPLFDVNILLFINLIKHLGYGVFYGLAGYVISKVLMPSAESELKINSEDIQKSDYSMEENAKRSGSDSRQSWGKITLFGFLIYLPMAAIGFLSDMYAISSMFDFTSVGVGSLLGWVYMLLLIVYLPFMVIAMPYITESGHSFRKALSTGWDYFLANFFAIFLSVITALFMAKIFQFGIQGSYMLFSFLLDDVFGFMPSNQLAEYEFYISVIIIFVSSLFYITALIVPLVGYSFYYLLKQTEGKKNLNNAFTEMMNRLSSFRGGL